jgi:hypothetical protein
LRLRGSTGRKTKWEEQEQGWQECSASRFEMIT